MLRGIIKHRNYNNINIFIGIILARASNAGIRNLLLLNEGWLRFLREIYTLLLSYIKIYTQTYLVFHLITLTYPWYTGNLFHGGTMEKQIVRSKDLAAALGLFGVKATYVRSPRGEWVVALENGFVHPVEGGFEAASRGSKEILKLDGPGLLSWIAGLLDS